MSKSTKVVGSVDLGAASPRVTAALALSAPTGMLPPVQAELRAYLDTVLSAGLVPAHIKSPEQALVILTKGHELGMKPMASLAGIYIVKGLPSLKTETVLALAFARIPDLSVEVLATSAEEADVIVRRGRSSMRSRWTIEDAKRARLLGSDGSGWQKYPRDMLRWRAISAALRVLAPDALQGTYTVEELEGSGVDAGGVATVAEGPEVRRIEVASGPAVEVPEERPVEVKPEVKQVEGLAPTASEAAREGWKDLKVASAAEAKATAAPDPGRISDLRRAFGRIVEVVIALGVHANAPKPETAAVRYASEKMGRPIAPLLREAGSGSMPDADVVVLTAKLTAIADEGDAEVKKRAEFDEGIPF